MKNIPAANNPLIVMLSDFGGIDPFVGIMKGVIASIAPETRLLDLTHEIPPGDVLRGAVTLWQSRPYFQPGTIFLGVVDPGVGTVRRPVLIESAGQIFIGPDNGLFTFIFWDEYQAWELRNSKYFLPVPGITFHGRDVFAPAAAHAANGVRGPEFGSPVDTLFTLPTPFLDAPAPQILIGEILYPDRFGNLLTSLGRFIPSVEGFFQLEPWIGNVGTRVVRDAQKRMLFRPGDFQLSLPGGEKLPWVDTFAESPVEGCAFLVGSSGLLEIVADRKNAAQILGLSPGDQVILRSEGER